MNQVRKIEDTVKKYVIHHRMFKWRGHAIVALSGGADSVALLLILKHLGLTISAAHCNFHLRGEESDRDEQFCIDLCQREGIGLHRIHFDTLAYARLHKVSIEMAARELRYRYFAQLAKDTDADGICVAHHRDDNAETVLLNLLRGSGIDGLAGIAPKNGDILRPLLCISRADILAYLKELGQAYVTDSTNLEDDALRNKIRHHVIPLLQSLNPAASENIAQSAKYLRQAKAMLDTLPTEDGTEHDELLSTIYINKQSILNAASPEYLLHKSIGGFGFTGDTIDSIVDAIAYPDGGVGKMWKNSQYMLTIDREQLLLNPLHQLEELSGEKAFRLPEEGNYSLGYENTSPAQEPKEAKIRLRSYPRTADFSPSREPRRITLDYDKVKFPLTYRLSKEGDRFSPFGMKGTKLVSDYMTDRKRNYIQKASQHVLTDGEGEIIWLVGERTSELTKITETTQKILEITIE